MLPLVIDVGPAFNESQPPRVHGVAGYDLQKGSSNTSEVLNVVFAMVRGRAKEIGALFGHDEDSVGVRR